MSFDWKANREKIEYESTPVSIAICGAAFVFLGILYIIPWCMGDVSQRADI